MPEGVQCVVVGGGVIGLACARALAQGGREVLLIERESQLGQHQSSRNSEVIHAGLYYPRGSLKAELCVAGRIALYRFLEQRNIAHRRCGKLVIATSPAELDGLQGLHRQARANGVTATELWSERQVRERQPELRCAGALWSPDTGIFDTHGYMQALEADLCAAAGSVLLANELRSARLADGGFYLDTGEGEVFCQQLILAAGADSPALARRIQGLDAARVPQGFLAKGRYWAVNAACPFDCLVFPLPQPGGLGIHLSLDLAGQARLGPDVCWDWQEDYAVERGLQAVFAESVQRWWPGLPEHRLTPAYAGIRAKLSAEGQPAADFRIDGPAQHGQPGLVCLYGIESPGMTASLAIAERVRRRLAERPGC